MRTVKEAKAKMTVGTRLLCVRNTYRPELNGTERVITKSPGTTWRWRSGNDEKESHSVWPSGIKVVDEATIRIPLDLRRTDGVEHYLELRFIEVAPPTPKTTKLKEQKPSAWSYTSSAAAFDRAHRLNRYTHKDAVVWKEGDTWLAAVVNADALSRAIHAVGDFGKFAVMKGGTGFNIGPALARVYIANLEAGQYCHG